MIATGRFDEDATLEHTGDFATVRPSTRQRDQGRVALTVLQPHPEVRGAPGPAPSTRRSSAQRPATRPTRATHVCTRGAQVVLAAQEAEEALQEAAAQAANSGREVTIAELRQQAEEERLAKGGKLSSPVPLKVVLGPQRPRQVISFADRIISNDDPSRPTLTIFEHIDGSRVCKDMFPSYQLPNGKQAYMYYNGGVLLDEVAVDAVVPPPRPSTVPQALQQTMPLADVLNLIAKPPGSAPPFIPYKPVSAWKGTVAGRFCRGGAPWQLVEGGALAGRHVMGAGAVPGAAAQQAHAGGQAARPAQRAELWRPPRGQPAARHAGGVVIGWRLPLCRGGDVCGLHSNAPLASLFALRRPRRSSRRRRRRAWRRWRSRRWRRASPGRCPTPSSSPASRRRTSATSPTRKG